jgi:AcrR family transcriptional regulator
VDGDRKTARRWEVGGVPRAGVDPTADLSPTAARILEASKRLLDEKGFAGLTFEAIAAEAGENRASIRYHFANKAGLIEALADSVVHDDNVALLKRLQQPDATDRFEQRDRSPAATLADLNQRLTGMRDVLETVTPTIAALK